MIAKKKYVMTKKKGDFRESIKWEQFLLKDTSQENEENKSILHLYL